jgi:hypothetical protein
MLTEKQKKLVEKYKADWASDPETCRAFIESDLNEADAKPVIEALTASAYSGPDSATAAAPLPKVYNPSNPNADLDLSGFNYNNLTDESFNEYMKLVDKLPGHQNRDFVQYMASGVFKTVLNDNADKVLVITGIKINRADPVNSTRIPVAMARDLNRQIMNRDNPSTNSRYYLLKKLDDQKIK